VEFLFQSIAFTGFFFVVPIGDLNLTSPNGIDMLLPPWLGISPDSVWAVYLDTTLYKA
jgi:hypothetical protein